MNEHVPPDGAELDGELGPIESKVVAALSPRDRASLVAAVRDARARQRAALQASIDAAMDHVPRVLRGALRMVLFR